MLQAMAWCLALAGQLHCWIWRPDSIFNGYHVYQTKKMHLLGLYTWWLWLWDLQMMYLLPVSRITLCLEQASLASDCWATAGGTCNKSNKKNKKGTMQTNASASWAWSFSALWGKAGKLAWPSFKQWRKINDMVLCCWPSTWWSAWHVLVKAPVYMVGMIGTNGKALCAQKKPQSIGEQMDAVMGSTIGAHVKKHYVLKNNSKSTVCSLPKQLYSTKCSNKKSSGLSGGLGGSVGASSYNIVYIWRNIGIFIPEKLFKVLCGQELLQPAKKHMTHTQV